MSVVRVKYYNNNCHIEAKINGRYSADDNFKLICSMNFFVLDLKFIETYSQGSKLQ